MAEEFVKEERCLTSEQAATYLFELADYFVLQRRQFSALEVKAAACFADNTELHFQNKELRNELSAHRKKAADYREMYLKESANAAKLTAELKAEREKKFGRRLRKLLKEG